MFASKDIFLTPPRGGYTISRSLRFRSSASAYLNRTFGTPTNNKIWTWSGWVKRGTLGAAQTLFSGQVDVNNWGIIGFLSGDTLSFQQADAASVTSTVTTTQVFRDPAAWYHIIVVFDSTQATAANRLKMYVNGSQITAFGTATYLSQNTASRINTAIAHQISRYISASQYFDGYLTEINFIDGQALTPSSFGAVNVYGSWSPIKYAGTYGTNGFYLPFTNNASTTTLGYDFSPNGNNWTTNNISLTAGVTYDSMTDVPTLTSATAANYAVMNPLNQNSTGVTITNGNLDVSRSSSSNGQIWSTMGMTSGKWYAEVTMGDVTEFFPGIANGNMVGANRYLGQDSNTWAYYYDGRKVNSATYTSYGNSYTNGDVIGVAFDADTGALYFYKNGTVQNSGTAAFTGLTSGPYFYACSAETSATANSWNFGQRPFAYTPPSGFVALNTYNL